MQTCDKVPAEDESAGRGENDAGSHESALKYDSMRGTSKLS